MAKSIQPASRNRSKPKRRKNSRKQYQSVQKPSGNFAARVQKVGPDKFALVCIDPAKHRSEWMMADYFGNVLIEPRTLEHQAGHFETALMLVGQAQQRHGLAELLVTVERTGNLHLVPRQAFLQAGFEVRVVHPFATKQFRAPADPGNKTDPTDLFAQHRAAIAGFALQEPLWDDLHRRLQVHIRHRRLLIEKETALICQIREHLHLALPGYAELFSNLFSHQAALAIARHCTSAHAVLDLGQAGLARMLREHQIRFQSPTLDKIVAWAGPTTRRPINPQASCRHALWTDLDGLREELRRKIRSIELEIVTDLVQTPYVRLLTIPGIHVVSAADFAGEMGPIRNYPNANAITGRSGIYPSRYQSDETDLADGPLVRQSNRQLRAAIMRIADNLVRHNNHFRGRAQLDRSRKVDERRIRVKVAKSFTRIAYAAVAGDEPLRHRCAATRDSIVHKLREFLHQHGAPPADVLELLEPCVQQLLPETRGHEAELVAAQVLEQQARRRRGPTALGDLLPALLARLGGTPETREDTAPN